MRAPTFARSVRRYFMTEKEVNPMSKERLEEIEVQGYENDGDNRLFVKLKEDDYLYLREQIERVQELEEENMGLHEILSEAKYSDKTKLLGQNKRYREALEHIKEWSDDKVAVFIAKINLEGGE